jgi:hypothetical protein
MSLTVGVLSPFVLLLLFAFIVASRSVYRWLVPHSLDRDAYAHLLYAKHIKEHGHRIPDRPDMVVTDGRYGYPFLMHWLLSFLPVRSYRTIDRYFSPATALAFAALVCTLYPLGVLDGSQLLLAVAVFAVTPQFVRPDMPDAVGISARMPGIVLTTAAVLAFTRYLATGALLAVTAAVVLGAGVFLLSKFSVQALLFVSIGLSVATPVAFGVYVASLLLAVVATGGVYARVLAGQIGFLHDYAVNKQQKLFKQPRLNPLAIARDIDSFEDLLTAAYYNRLVRPLINNPYVLLTVVAYALSTRGTTVSLPVGFHLWIWSCLGAFVLTSMPYLLFLGEPERYLVYGFLPMTVLVARAWDAFGIEYRVLVGTVLFAGLGVMALYVFLYERLFFSDDAVQWSSMLEFLRSKAPGTVLVQPYWNARRVAWETDHLVVDYVMNEGMTDNEKTDRLCPSMRAVVTNDVEWLGEAFQPDWVVFERDRLQEVERHEGLLPPSSTPVYEDDDFEVYRFAQLRD